MNKRNLIVLFAFLAILVASTIFHYRRGENRGISALPARVDTLYICDTIKVTEPIYITKKVIDKVCIPVKDTIRMTDTLVIEMDREQVQWRDSLCEVYASGLYPAIDTVIHFVREREIIKTVTRKEKCRWGAGIQAGYGMTLNNGAFSGSPYIGVGIQYNIFAW